MNRPAAVLLYPGCVFLEVAPLAELLASSREVHYFTPNGEQHVASNGARIVPHGGYAQALNHSHCAVVAPGGNPDSILHVGAANAVLQATFEAGDIVGGICAGALVLARAGLLRGRRMTHNYTPEHASAEMVAATQPFWAGGIHQRADVVVDGSVITANHWARNEFAAAVAQAIGLFSQSEANDYLHKQRFRYHTEIT